MVAHNIICDRFSRTHSLRYYVVLLCVHTHTNTPDASGVYAGAYHIASIFIYNSRVARRLEKGG